MIVIDAIQSERITMLVTVLGTCTVIGAFQFVRWFNAGLQAARIQFESDRVEHDAAMELIYQQEIEYATARYERRHAA